MSLFHFTIQKNGINTECAVLSIAPNNGYVALFLDDSNNVVKSHFPFFLFIQTDNDKYFLPGLAFIIANPQLGLEKYVGYALAEKCATIPANENYAFNPFMPSEVTDPIKAILEA